LAVFKEGKENESLLWSSLKRSIIVHVTASGLIGQPKRNLVLSWVYSSVRETLSKEGSMQMAEIYRQQP